MSGGGREQVTGRTTSEPPEWQVPWLKQVGGDAAGLYDKGIGPRYYPDQTFIDPTAQERAGLSRTQSLASNGNQMLPGLINQANRYINMQPGRGNKDFTGLLDIAAGRTRDAMATGFGAQGRDDPSGAITGQMGEAIGDLYTKGFAGQYNQDVANSMAWAGMAPSIRAQQFDDPSKMIGVGQAWRGELENKKQSSIDRWNALQSRDWDQLALFNNMVSGLGGNSGTQTTYGPKPNPWMGLLGAGMMGAGALGGGILGRMGGGGGSGGFNGAGLW